MPRVCRGLAAGPIVLSRDGRTSGPMLAASLIGGLTAVGREVINAGIAATPTTGIWCATSSGRRHPDLGQP